MPVPGQDDARSHKFQLFAGALELHPFSVSGLQHEQTAVDRPDRTRRVTDQTTPFDFTASFKLRDKVELAAVRAWAQTREHVDCTLNVLTEAEDIVAVFQILQVCPRMNSLSDLNTQEDATEVTQEWTFTADDLVQIV